MSTDALFWREVISDMCKKFGKRADDDGPFRAQLSFARNTSRLGLQTSYAYVGVS